MTRGRPTLLLALGDVAAFVAFGAIGMTSHEDGITFTTVARAVLVFPTVWLLLAPLAGAYSEDAVQGRFSLLRVVLIWVPIGVIALLVRAAVFDRRLFNAFFVVALIGDGLFITAWRAAYNRFLAPQLSTG